MNDEYRPRQRDTRIDHHKRPMRVTGRGLVTILIPLEQKRERERTEKTRADA